MLYYIIISLHIIIVLALIGVILIQRGRSGGLIEALGGVESIFGTKTSAYFVKATVVLAVLFFATSVTLAYLSKEKSRSLTEKYPSKGEQEKVLPAQDSTVTEPAVPAAQEPKN